MEFYDTSQIDVNLIKRSFSAGLTRIMPNGSAPIFTLSGLAKKKYAKQTEHGYWAKTMIFPKATLTVAALNVDTNLQISSAGTNRDGIIPGAVLRNQVAYSADNPHTGLAELILVTAIVDANNITVIRGFAGSTPIAIASGAVLPVVGNVHEQGSNAPTAVAIAPNRILNNTQIFRNTWALAGTTVSVKEEVGDGQKAENRRDCSFFHAQDIEKAIIFGQKADGTTQFNGRPLTAMDGIEASIWNAAPGNLYDAGAPTNYSKLESMLNPQFDYATDGSEGNVRSLYCGGTAISVINNIGRLSGQYQVVNGQTTFGLQFSQFRTSRGTFNMIEHPLLNTNDDWKSMAISLDLSQLDFCYLEGRDTFHTAINGKGQATNGKDEESGVLTSELTIEMRNAAACGIIYNLTSAA